MPPITVAPPNAPQPRLSSPWLHWDLKSLAWYDYRKPNGYDECLHDARTLVKKVEERTPDLYDPCRGRDVYECVTGVLRKDTDKWVSRLQTEPLEPEDFKTRLVKEFFKWSRDDLWITTNRGRAVRRELVNNVVGGTYPEIPLLMGSCNSRPPESPEEVGFNAKRNLAIYRSHQGWRPRIAPMERGHDVWASLPGRVAEDLLLFFNFWEDPKSDVARDLFLWARHADEESGVRLGKILLGEEQEAQMDRNTYNALLLDNDFVDLLVEKF